jgi:uncharacterized protein YjbJ (UPF0337 family)
MSSPGDARHDVLANRRRRIESRHTEIRVNKNQIEGSFKDVTGKVQQKVGQATSSTNQRVKGVARQIEGKVQKGVGHIEQALDRARRKPR